MQIIWNCYQCGDQLMKVTAREDDPRVAALTAQAGDDIIEVDRDGNLVVHLSCENCQGSIDPEEDRDITYLRGPELH